MKNSICILVLFFSFALKSYCQDDDWGALLDEELANQRIFTNATFKSSRILNGQSVEILPKYGLDLRIAHRFAELNTTDNNFLGFDEASTYFGLYYGIYDKLNVGIARATYNQTNYGFIKYALIRQSTGEKKIPLTIVFHSSISYTSKSFSDKNRDNDFRASGSGKFKFQKELPDGILNFAKECE